MGAPDGMTYSGNNIKMPRCLNRTEVDLSVDFKLSTSREFTVDFKVSFAVMNE